MTVGYSRHPAKFSGKCASCSEPIIHGDSVLTTHAPRRTYCKHCGNRWLMRLAHDAEYRKGAHDHAKWMDKRDKSD